MINFFTTKYYKLFTLIFCTICLIYFIHNIYFKFDNVFYSLKKIFSNHILLLTEFILLALNITLESLRWRIISLNLYHRPFISDIITTLRSTALANVTPANIGEHFGRVLNHSNKKKITLLSFFASYIQTFSICLVGTLSALYIHISNIEFSRTIIYIIYSISAICLIISSIALFFLSQKFKSIQKEISLIISPNQIILSIFTNIVRIIIFSLQLTILLNTPYIITPIFIYYFLLTFLPRLNFIDIGIKGNLALYTLATFYSQANIISATISIWIINIIIPSICGFIFIFTSSMFHVKH